MCLPDWEPEFTAPQLLREAKLPKVSVYFQNVSCSFQKQKYKSIFKFVFQLLSVSSWCLFYQNYRLLTSWSKSNIFSQEKLVKGLKRLRDEQEHSVTEWKKENSVKLFWKPKQANAQFVHWAVVIVVWGCSYASLMLPVKALNSINASVLLLCATGRVPCRRCH